MERDSGARRSGADPLVFNVQYPVFAVGKDNGGHVQCFPGLGPQGLQGIHAAAVRLQAQYLAVRTGQRRAGGIGQPLADGAAGREQPVMGFCRSGGRYQVPP